MRALGIAVLSLGVCLAYVQTPFTHVHAAGAATDHVARTHAGNLAFHIHLGQGQTGASLSDPGASQRSTNWYRFEVKNPVTWTVQPETVQRALEPLRPPRNEQEVGVNRPKNRA